MKRVLLVIGALLVLGFFSFFLYLELVLPSVGDAEDISIKISTERVERGKYLANAVAACMDCHSSRDWTRYAAPLINGTLGKGGEVFDQKIGFPGIFTSKNLTPYALRNWTDGEILRAISSGVNKAGKALFPVMPHPNYGQLDREDLYDIIAYLRTLDPIGYQPEKSSADFPMSLILNTIPQKAEFSKKPEPNDQLAYGKYIFTAASCNECHTKKDKGKPIDGMNLAGGFEFPLPSGGIVRSSNITPDKLTGIGEWTEERFVTRFKAFVDSGYTPERIEPGDMNTTMPWAMYGQMTEADLKALFAYLKKVPPVSNRVEKFSPAKKL